MLLIAVEKLLTQPPNSAKVKSKFAEPPKSDSYKAAA
jgi:hypothetical protein